MIHVVRVLLTIAGSFVGVLLAGVVFVLLKAADAYVTEEIKGWQPRLNTALLNRAVRHLPRSDRERYEEEWRAELYELRDRPISALLFAIGTCSSAKQTARALNDHDPQPLRETLVGRGLELIKRATRRGVARSGAPTFAAICFATFGAVAVLALLPYRPIDVADWIYLNAHYIVTFGVLLFMYLRRNQSFSFVRNMFLVAMLIALVGYAVYPTAPPRLMPEWGFTDAIRLSTGVTAENGTSSALLNLYAAIPAVHVCFSLLVGMPMARLVRHRTARIAWCVYPAFISFVVVATGSHYLTDLLLGSVTAATSALVANELLARARPDHWDFG